MRIPTPKMDARPAFTLVEVLVVIAIMGVLTALIAAAVTRAIPAQQQRNTETTLRKIDSALKSHWRAVIEDASEEFARNSSSNAGLAVVKQLAGGDNARAKVLWTKMRLVQQFPMTYQEVFYPTGAGGPVPADTTYATLLMQRLGLSSIPPFAAVPAPTNAQTGACLLMALTSKAHRSVKQDDDYFNPSEKKDTDGDGQLELVDAWGKPLSFYRWPTGNPDVQAMRPTSSMVGFKFADQLDPMGTLLATGWNNATNQALITNLEMFYIHHPIHLGTTPQTWTPTAFVVFPTAVSAGMDGQLDLDYWMTPGTTGAANDNIYSFLLK